MGESKAQQQTDENAKVVAGLLKQLMDKKQPAVDQTVNGTTNGAADDLVASGA